jgi:hypothetical protein
MTLRRLLLSLAFGLASLSCLTFATPALACGDGKDCPCHQKKAAGAKGAKKDAAPATKEPAKAPVKTADASPCQCEKGGKHCTCAKGQCHCANCGDKARAI